MSISSIYEETKKLKHIHGAETIMCTIPGDPLLLGYTKFPNQNYIFRFSQVLACFQNLESVMIHIEYWIAQFLRNITVQDIQRLRKIRNVNFNMMIQNIDYLASIDDVAGLKKLGKLTCTTAHERYSTHELSQRFECPLYKFSVSVSPEKYTRKAYSEKENLMIVSPDIHPRKVEVLNLIASRFPNLRLQIIKNVTYEKYKEIISRAKWALTFGEGLDGYFVETIFSGGISFSAYNPKFFTEDFRSLSTVYDDYDALVQKICSDISLLDNEANYAKYQNKQYELCHKYYDHKQYVRNLSSFYEKEYADKRADVTENVSTTYRVLARETSHEKRTRLLRSACKQTNFARYNTQTLGS
jgi:hypothetical protein